MNNQVGVRTLVRIYQKHRFLVLLVLLLLHIVLSIVYEGAEYRLLRTTLVSLALLAAIGCLEMRWVIVRYLRWFGVVTIAGGWFQVAFDLAVVSIMSGALRIIFFLVVAAALIYQIATSREVTGRIIIGSVDGYLLLGLVGGVAFAIVDTIMPGSLVSAGAQLSQPDYVYFAFITMATVGYGDIAPAAPAARSIAVLLAVAGQLYIAVLMALLVGKYIGARK